MSIKGVYFGFFLPANMLAASVAKRPRVLPLASTTNHLRVISCELGKYVDIVTSSPKKPSLGQALHTDAKIRGRQLLSRKRKVQISGVAKIRFRAVSRGIAQSASSFAFLAGY